MNEREQQQQENQSSTGQAWDDVGRQFRLFGESLASAFKTTWESEETQHHWDNIQVGLEAMVDELRRAAEKVASTEEAEKVKTEAKKAAQSAQAAGTEAAAKMEPHLLAAFQKIRAELDQIINRMEQSDPGTEPESNSGTAAE